MYLDKVAYDFYNTFLSNPDEPDVDVAVSLIEDYAMNMDRDDVDNVAQLYDMRSVYMDFTMTQCSEA
jgi:hypothetical protein